MKNLITKIIACAVVTLVASPTPASAQCLAAKQFNGHWYGSDGGTYWMRQTTDNVVWWVGMSADQGKTWTHVFKGTKSGDVITGEWADVRGKGWGKGTLTLRLYRFDSMERTGSTGSGYAATRWDRGPCNDTAGSPG